MSRRSGEVLTVAIPEALVLYSRTHWIIDGSFRVTSVKREFIITRHVAVNVKKIFPPLKVLGLRGQFRVAEQPPELALVWI